MDTKNAIIQPYLNAEVYRSHNTDPSITPNYDFLRIHSDGALLIGCSNLTGRYWKGSAKFCTSLQDYRKPEIVATKQAVINLESGATDGCFLASSTKVLLCEDSGAVSVWEHATGAWSSWTSVVSALEHDSAVLAVQCLKLDSAYVTAGADGNIKVWDISDMLCVKNYSAGHTIITDISVKPNSPANLASSSTDYCLCLWDTCADACVQTLYRGDCGLRCVRWLDEHRLLFGDEAGVLRMVDSRSPGNVVNLAAFPAPVHRMVVSNESKKVAVCCDNRIVTVYEVSADNNAKLVYEDRQSHTDYVRGLAWDPMDRDLLHTVAWDEKLATHKIS